MGNAGSNQPGHHHGSAITKDTHRQSKDHPPSSPGRDGQAFTFAKKPNKKLVFQTSNEEEEPYLSKEDDEESGRPRSNTISEGSKIVVQSPDPPKSLPTVFKWEGGGKEVYIGGKKNNLITVRKSDFEVFQALAKDSEGGSSSIQSEFCQEVPAQKPWDRVPGPPVLPPHLLQVILNKDTPLSCEPTLLPEPNHVMLNHLYALSIKESVMVLSATHRYRKKYVTTLLYKPI
ncbi:hypothetical protein G9C98_005671 [Cotesia typhae]|uniref:Association with the SNF1 complex (ASC) domain-containing protein n=1 Tax=Cotesia typhae TaxID=2053667 RepID=A0A8J5R9F0_9HYME|nr:hypothetical protein G9C98_005671 [Cotesia typhae]